jgi:hypothetical protein
MQRRIYAQLWSLLLCRAQRRLGHTPQKRDPISSLTALQLVEVMHTLYSTPTLQDINTVENDLKRPLAHFEDFLDHVNNHINNYESLRSFNQQVSNITRCCSQHESIPWYQAEGA